MQIWKFNISESCAKRNGTARFQAPFDGDDDTVFIGMQNRDVCLWAKVFPGDKERTREFAVVGTGHEIHCDYKYVGTVLDGAWVWHVFEVP